MNSFVTTAGTVTVTNGSAAITFSAFDPGAPLNGVVPGDTIQLGAAMYLLAAVGLEGTKAATLAVPYAGTTGTVAAGGWTVCKNSPDRNILSSLAALNGAAMDSMRVRASLARVFPVVALQAAPPASPVAGKWYAVAPQGTGDWSGKDGYLAYRLSSTWYFQPPVVGDIATTPTGQLQWSGTAWADVVTATFSSSIIGRNLLMNPTFRINQRGKSGTVTLEAGEYGHDGVRAGAAGLTYTFAYSGSDITITIESGSLIMPVEGLMVVAGAYLLTHEGTATARVWQGTGTAGSGSYASVPATGLAATLTAGTQVNVEFTSGTVRRPQFIFGSIARAFERRQYNLEVALCQRYFARMGGADLWTTFGQGFFTSATSGRSILSTPEIMRARPSMTVSDPSLFGVIYGAVSLTPSAITLNRWSGAFSKDVVVMATVTGATVGAACQLRANNSTSAYLDFSAELP